MDRKTHRGESREWTRRLIVEKVENGQEDYLSTDAEWVEGCGHASRIVKS